MLSWPLLFADFRKAAAADRVLAATPRQGAPNANASDDWPQFRGPDGQGHSAALGLPTSWSESANIVWKVPLPGLGWSSPVIRDEHIWLTTAVRDGRSLRALCVERESGKLLHEVEVFGDNSPGHVHALNSHASPTPVLDGDHLYVHFGPYGTACLTDDGKVVWKNRLAYNPGYGPTSTPVVCDDLLIV